MPAAVMDESMTDQALDLDTTTHEILLAATNHDLDALRILLKKGSANVRDEETGITPLHAAVLSCAEDVDEEHAINGTSSEGSTSVADQAIHTRALAEQGAVDTIKLLFENGAIWNDLDQDNETAGCAALRLGLEQAYALIVEAGVRAELLLNRLDEFNMLGDGVDEDEQGEGMEVEDTQDTVDPTAVQGQDVRQSAAPEIQLVDENGTSVDVDVTSARYLASELKFGGDRLVDADDNGVMMAWETELMAKSAAGLVQGEGKRILNIGHGMGIIDGLFQQKNPSAHHIVEAHPSVLQRMKDSRWHDKASVTVHEGRWQDQVRQMLDDGLVFDAIYFDTFAEDYKELREFFSDYVISLMAPDGKFGFFNGLGADRQICYDIYTKVAEMDLFEAGLDTSWTDISVADLDKAGEWEGIRRKYWSLPVYRMPICTFLG